MTKHGGIVFVEIGRMTELAASGANFWQRHPMMGNYRRTTRSDPIVCDRAARQVML